MKTIINFLRPNTFLICIAYLFTFVELIVELFFPFILSIIINEGIVKGDSAEIIKWGLIMFGMTAIAFSAGIMNSFFASHISNVTSYSIREQLFIKIQDYSFKTLNTYPVSMIVTRFTNDIRQIQNTIFMALRVMAKAPFLIIGSVTMSFIINVKLSLIFLVIVPILILFLYWVLIKGSRMFTKVQETVDWLNRIIQENIIGMRVIKSFVRSDFESKRFETANTALSKKTQTAFRFVEASMPVLLFVMNLSLIFIIWFGHQLIVIDQINVGDVVAIVNYALRTVMAISMLTFISLAFSRARASSERVEKMFLEKTVSKEMDLHAPIITEGQVVYKDVSFHYPNHHVKILDQINFQVAPQEILAILGSTGSGKTTLFQLLPRLYEPNEGEIYIDGKNITSYQIDHLREKIGYVSQTPLLFTGTIRDNITFGKNDATDDEVIRAAQAAQIHDTIAEMPQGYDSIVGQKGVNLSGGQKQRLSIARALIRQPKILMLDDSTSALDLQTEMRLLKALKTYQSTMLIITQKIITAQTADKILLLDQGKVQAFGTHESLMKDSVLYQQIVDTQAERKISS